MEIVLVIVIQGSGNKLVQAASRRRLNTSSDGESTTCCGSLFHGETTLTANEFARDVRNAVGFRRVSECPLRLQGGLRVNNFDGSMRTFPFGILNIQIRSPRKRRLFIEKRPRMASRTSYGKNLSDGTSLVAMRWTFSIFVMSPAVVGDQA